MTLRLKKDKTGKAAEPSPGEQASSLSTEPLNNVAGTPRPAQRIPLPHNSMFVMGLETNAKWLHGINHDNRPVKIKSPEEQAEEGGRISLTFRHIGTFLNKDESLIWGQGAKGKTKEQARPVVYDKRQVERIIHAFGDENQQSGFDWEKAYGLGFDVLHFTQKDEVHVDDSGGTISNPL
jgi:hypothetical protein